MKTLNIAVLLVLSIFSLALLVKLIVKSKSDRSRANDAAARPAESYHSQLFLHGKPLIRRLHKQKPLSDPE